MTHGEKARAYFMEGYNCAQAVALAFADEMGVTPEMAARMSSSFGGGLGRMREVCGSVSGMALAAGAIFGYDDPKAPDAAEQKKEHYARIQKLAEEFKAQNGSIICRELLAGINSDTAPTPEKRTAEYYKKRPCVELVVMAAEILEKELAEVARNSNS